MLIPLVLILAGVSVAIWVASRPSAAELEARHARDIADEQQALPQGTDAWYKVAEVCHLGNDTMTDYEEVNRSDYDAVYTYQDDVGDEHEATVSLNDYGTITWVDSCDHIDGVPDTYSDRVDINW